MFLEARRWVEGRNLEWSRLDIQLKLWRKASLCGTLWATEELNSNKNQWVLTVVLSRRVMQSNSIFLKVSLIV